MRWPIVRGSGSFAKGGGPDWPLVHQAGKSGEEEWVCSDRSPPKLFHSLAYPQADAAHSEALAAERSARIAAESDAATVRKECDRRMAELESQLAEAAANAVPGGFDEPPAMAAPGYR